MPCDVQAVALFEDPFVIELCHSKRFNVGLGLQQPITGRQGNARSSIGHDVVRRIAQNVGGRQIIPDIVAPHEACDRNDERTALTRNESCDVLGVAHVAGPDCDM